MEKPNETAENITEPDASPPWGTWEELLLSCAVHRHGTDNWDSVAIEIQKRSSTPSSLLHLTPSHCKQKYRDLKQRYSPPDDDAGKAADADAVPWLDELRKLRVAELRREVERYDASIVSLQLKVKRLKEEREEEGEKSNGGEKSDPEKTLEREREDDRGKVSPESVAGGPVSGGDDRSVNESNSTDPNKTGKDGGGDEPEPVRTGEGEPDGGAGLAKPVGENSCNGSSNSIEKEEEEEPVRESVKDEPGGGRGDSAELGESVAESKGAAAAKEVSSDVQSSASKSRKEEELGDDKVRSGCVSGGDEPEDVDQSRAVERASVESRSLVEFLEIVRSHKLGSVFEQRLERQETPEYKDLIRQHVDLESIQTRLKEGWYSSFNSKFYRDLLLLFNNAILFFGKESRESTAAIELRQLVSKEMTRTNLKFDSSAEERTPTPSQLVLSSKPEPEPSSDSLLPKPKIISGPMIVCRKRSSIAAKALIGSSNSGGADRKREQKAEEKPILDWKQPNKKSSGNNAEENNRATKKRTSDRFASAGSRSSKKNGKNRASPNPSKNSEPLSSEHSEPRSEKNAAAPTTVSGGAKKRSAANFLSRMKRGSTTTNNNGSTLLDTLKNSGVSSGMNTRGGGGEQKRSGGNGKGGDGKKEQVVTSRRGSGAGRQAKEKEKEQGSPAKRNVGRPKRAAAPPPSTPAAISGKRSREGGGGDKEAGASRQPKKRSRR
ncbi:hypothetical protein RHMOL_Rhmol03G0008700 [Rhododendron molle]|uniref:Uncharacterized protein n=1 Tax=Rhododendron molle TaxID=49168 RepID=A0ACC0PAN7_RHOML|nr:hypothetical protein RHMOL_Rhmol03G0008700 [Rhododendron molle]